VGFSRRFVVASSTSFLKCSPWRQIGKNWPSTCAWVIYGREYWDRGNHFQALVDAGTISPKDLDLFTGRTRPRKPLKCLRQDLTTHHLDPQVTRDKEPDIAKRDP